jgi:competence/damage-inducible protein CinA-like protein
MRAEIISIGDEITSGITVDTNAAWLAARLAESGIRTVYHTTVADQLQANIEVFDCAIRRADIIISTGGLGPTDDDLTREVLSQVTGRTLIENKRALEHIKNLFARRSYPMPQSNRVQALLPEGSRMIDNPEGSAPGIAMTVKSNDHIPCHLYALPGVPAEMKAIYAESIEPELAALQKNARLIRHRKIHCFGAGESLIESMLPGLIARDREPIVGITASGATITLRITASGATADDCLEAIRPTAELIYAKLGNLIYGEGDDRLQDVVIRLLETGGQTMATIEANTDGLLTQWLASAAKQICSNQIAASLILDCDSAIGQFLIEHHSLDRYDSIATAIAMAQTIRKRFSTDYGLAIGPASEHCRLEIPRMKAVDPTDDSTVEAVTVALATKTGVQTELIPLSSHPAIRQTVLAKAAINGVRLALLEN